MDRFSRIVLLSGGSLYAIDLYGVDIVSGMMWSSSWCVDLDAIGGWESYALSCFIFPAVPGAGTLIIFMRGSYDGFLPR